MTSTGPTATARCLLVLLLLGFASPIPLQLTEGDACSDGSSAGFCQRVRHCQPALQALQQRRPLPQRCGFVGLEEVVCCPKSDLTEREGDSDDPGNGGGNDGGTNDITSGNLVNAPSGDRPCTAACNNYKNQRNGLDDYIIGGTIAADQEFPHMAALGYNVPNTEGVSWLCGGTLVSDQFVLTAAHCCASRLTGLPVSVRLGTLSPSSEAGGGSEYGVSEVILHPNYRRRRYHSDIALLKLDRRVQFGDAVFPACINTQAADTSYLIATGWGGTNAAGTRVSSVLMKATISQFPLSDCQSTYKERFPMGLDSSVICAGDPQGKRDTCLGDSGGPLVTGNSAPYAVVGITSLGPKPCGGTVPSIYTRVSSYVDWLEEHVWP